MPPLPPLFLHSEFKEPPDLVGHSRHNDIEVSLVESNRNLHMGTARNSSQPKGTSHGPCPVDNCHKDESESSPSLTKYSLDTDSDGDLSERVDDPTPVDIREDSCFETILTEPVSSGANCEVIVQPLAPAELFSFYHSTSQIRHWSEDEHVHNFICPIPRGTSHLPGGPPKLTCTRECVPSASTRRKRCRASSGRNTSSHGTPYHDPWDGSAQSPSPTHIWARKTERSKDSSEFSFCLFFYN